MHDDCGEEKEQKNWRVLDHHEVSQEFLASSLSYFEITLLMDVSAMLVKQWMSMKALDFAVHAASDFSLLSWSIAYS